MTFRVFSQLPELSPVRLVQAATRFFEASLEVLAQPSDGVLRLRISSARLGFSADFAVETRPKTPEDQAAAARAELNGRSGGMAALCERCAHVWCVEASDGGTALYNLCAILASVALGPVLPPDDSALFGVRGAMERVERLSGRSLSR
ncbi:MAG: hypothetical protein QM756_23385 [Polyangiaceae bacterium]